LLPAKVSETIPSVAINPNELIDINVRLPILSIKIDSYECEGEVTIPIPAVESNEDCLPKPVHLKYSWSIMDDDVNA